MRRERLLPLIVAVALFMESMDSTVIATSLPAIAADLGTEPLALRLAVTSYLVSLAIAIPASGWLADRFGPRRVLCFAITVFMIGSIGCALSGSLASFVIARVVQGVGGAMMTPVGRLVLARAIDKRSLVDAMSWLAIPALVGPVVGPPLGGFLTTYFSWHWIFLINIPIGLIGIVMVLRFVKDFPDSARGRFDFLGWFLVGLGLAGLAFGFSVLGLAFVPPIVTALLIVGGFIFSTAYVWHARKHPAPVLDLSLLRLATMSVNVYGGGLFRTGVGALPFLLPMMLQLGFHLSPLQSGLITLATALGAMQMKAVAPAVLRRYGFRKTLLWNAWISAVLLAACAMFTPATPYAVMVGVLIVNGFFRSLQFTSVNTIAYAELQPHQISNATPLLAVVQQLSASAGVALGAIVVDVMVFAHGHAAPDASDFPAAFIVVALVSASSAWFFWRLPANAGEELANRLPAPEPAEQSDKKAD